MAYHCVARMLYFVILIFLGCTFVAAQKVLYNPVSPEVVAARLRKYAGNDSQREATLKQLLSDAGCGDPNLTEQKVKGSKIPNVICTFPGSTNRTIIVGAHFDHVAKGDGVVDNWSGASLLPSLYEAIKVEPRKHTFIFIGFTDEEMDEVGSRFYVQNMSKEEVARTDAMVNMDTIGLAPTKVWVSHSDKHLQDVLAYAAQQLNLPVAGVNVERVGSTDSEQFARRKIPSITIHSLTQETWNARILHTDRDRISELRLDCHYQTYRLLSAYLALLDEMRPRPEIK